MRYIGHSGMWKAECRYVGVGVGWSDGQTIKGRPLCQDVQGIILYHGSKHIRQRTESRAARGCRKAAIGTCVGLQGGVRRLWAALAGEWRQLRRSRACVLLVAGASVWADIRRLVVGRGDHWIPPLRVLDDCLSNASWELGASQDRPIARIGMVVRIGRTGAPSFVLWC